MLPVSDVPEKDNSKLESEHDTYGQKTIMLNLLQGKKSLSCIGSIHKCDWDMWSTNWWKTELHVTVVKRH